jgi:hypothetical protein
MYDNDGNYEETYLGYLHADVIQCLDHGVPVGAARLYRVNIGDYRQTCHICDKVMVEGKTLAWCELFPKQESAPTSTATASAPSGL